MPQVGGKSPGGEEVIWAKIARLDTRNKSAGRVLDISDPKPRDFQIGLPDSTRTTEDDAKQYAPKYAINYCRYMPEGGSSTTHIHWIDEDDLFLLAWRLMITQKGDKSGDFWKPMYEEHKGGPAGKRFPQLGEGGLIARTLKVTYVERDNKNEMLRSGPAYRIDFTVHKGVKGDTGQIMPADKEALLSEFFQAPVKDVAVFGASIYRYLLGKSTAAFLHA